MLKVVSRASRACAFAPNVASLQTSREMMIIITFVKPSSLHCWSTSMKRTSNWNLFLLQTRHYSSFLLRQAFVTSKKLLCFINKSSSDFNINSRDPPCESNQSQTLLTCKPGSAAYYNIFFTIYDSIARNLIKLATRLLRRLLLLIENFDYHVNVNVCC